MPYSVEEVAIDGTSYSKMITDNLEVGDLLFFGKRERVRVTHVGLWIRNNEFIHSSGRVHVTSVDPTSERYEVNYIERLMGIKRINGGWVAPICFVSA